MSRKCQISGKKVAIGNNFPKSNKKTKRVFLPNLQTAVYKSDILNVVLKLKISTRMIRTIAKYGNIDSYLSHAKARNLTEFAQKIRRNIKKKQVLLQKTD